MDKNTSITEEEFNQFYTPKQILFLSADLVGSTALKQKKRRKAKGIYFPDTQDWASAIQSFYSYLTSHFASSWDVRFKRSRRPTDSYGSKPILWKTIGDEMIWRKHISRTDQLAHTLHCFVEAVRETTDKLREQFDNEQIEIKCTAWIAEFPIQNKVLLGGQFEDYQLFDPNDKGKLLRALSGYSDPIKFGLEIDFVGPAIDIGFRLSKRSTSRKFIMSIDTAFIYLSYSRLVSSKDAKHLPIRFDGSARLDGVMGGVPYPLFWLDMGNSNSTDFIEDKLVGSMVIEPSEALEYCDAFYLERRNYVDKPYIYEEKDHYAADEGREEPAWHKEVIDGYLTDYQFDPPINKPAPSA